MESRVSACNKKRNMLSFVQCDPGPYFIMASSYTVHYTRYYTCCLHDKVLSVNLFLFDYAKLHYPREEWNENRTRIKNREFKFKYKWTIIWGKYAKSYSPPSPKVNSKIAIKLSKRNDKSFFYSWFETVVFCQRYTLNINTFIIVS